MTISDVTIHDAEGAERYAFRTGDEVEVRFHVKATSRVTSPFFSLGISGGGPGTLILCSMLDGGEPFDIPQGEHVVSCRIASLPLGPRTYELWTSVRSSAGVGDIVDWSQVGSIRIVPPLESEGSRGFTLSRMYSPVVVDDSWGLAQ